MYDVLAMAAADTCVSLRLSSSMYAAACVHVHVVTLVGSYPFALKWIHGADGLRYLDSDKITPAKHIVAFDMVRACGMDVCAGLGRDTVWCVS